MTCFCGGLQTINDVALGVTLAGLSCYLNRKYGDILFQLAFKFQLYIMCQNRSSPWMFHPQVRVRKPRSQLRPKTISQRMFINQKNDKHCRCIYIYILISIELKTITICSCRHWWSTSKVKSTWWPLFYRLTKA